MHYHDHLHALIPSVVCVIIFCFSSGDICQPSLLPYGIHNHEWVAAHGSYTPILCWEYA